MKALELEQYPYRMFCHLCGKLMAASNNPFPKSIQNRIKRTPCSNCVSPEKYKKKLEMEIKNNPASSNPPRDLYH